MAKIGINLATGTIEKPNVVVGIDLGTTNSLVAYIDRSNQAAKLIGESAQGIVPSVIYFDENNYPIIGSKAKEQIAHYPERTVFSVKRLLGKNYQDIDKTTSLISYKVIEDNSDNVVKVQIGERFYNPIQLSAIILRELKEKAEQELNATVDKAVITVPAYFNDSQRQATRDAGKLAGLDVLRIINEPTAASLAYGIVDNDVQKTILVYDFGGGTFDVSILRLDHGVFEVLSTHGDTYLGGDDIDKLIVDHWLNQYSLSIESLDHATMQSLRLKAENTKVKLSANRSLLVSEEIEGIGICELDYTQLTSLTQPILQKTLNSVNRALKDADLNENELDEIVLVGGSTRYPEILNLLKSKFPSVHINNTINPDEVVALGAAIEADRVSGNRNDILLLDVTPLSLGIETAGSLMDVLIPRNSKIPTRVGREYTTSVDGQVNLRVSVYQGERELVTQNRKLGEFILTGIPAMPAGLPKIEIQFALNSDGILKVKAKELRSGIEQAVQIEPTYGLTDQQVEQMLMSGLENAATDIESRLNVEAENEAKQLIYSAQRFLEKHGSFLTENEILGTKQLIDDLNCLLGVAERHKILSAIEMLNEYTKPFAERLMDEAVGAALKGNKIDSL